jgi:4-O-beta-D-mannosyl-D-glucose phosphorylase
MSTKGLTFKEWQDRLKALKSRYRERIERKNVRLFSPDGIIHRYRYPVMTAEQTPLHWRFDLDPSRNPYLLERLGINSTFHPGAIRKNGTVHLVFRVEGKDRKSFFAVAESKTGTDGFQFWHTPVVLPETEDPDVNVYDMRLTEHEDGWIYGVFCVERKDPNASAGQTPAAMAQAGIARTRDLRTWVRLPDLKTPSPQQRNVVLHPEFVDGQYAFYTRPQDEFIQAGTGGGIGWALCEDIEHAVVDNESIIEDRQYHTIKESKNGQGPPPLKTSEGWLHLAHGVRETCSGLRYVLYLFVTDLADPSHVLYRPGGYLMAPFEREYSGDVYNVLFSVGWVRSEDDEVLIYYASGDTRTHVASTCIDRLLDYAKHTPPDPLRSPECVQQRINLIEQNSNL